MTAINIDALDAALDALPKRFPGPGGVAGVVLEGKVIAARAWGYKDLDAAAPMTAQTRLPICSITKQFTCQVLLAELGEPEAHDGKVATYLPQFTGTLPTLRQLCDNQSGLRDYWALTVLQGAMAEQPFRREDALPLIARMKTGHFPPGTAYSYCNCNFRIISEIIETETGADLESLYRRHVWGPAGMKTAALTSDTSRPEDGVTGYEGNAATGYFPADNRIFWIGDAGISASLDDMLAYEIWVDATRNDPQSLYRRVSGQPHYIDGTPAAYGLGIARDEVAGRVFTGHGGALRGFRAKRLNAREDRLSVVVMFNHEGDPHGAAVSLIEAAFGHSPTEPDAAPEGHDGQWLADNGLLASLSAGRRGVSLTYNGWGPDLLDPAADGSLTSPGVTLRRDGVRLVMSRRGDNTVSILEPLPIIDTADGTEIAGRWHSPELEADLVIEARDGGIYARFEGMLGTGRMERMAPVGRDVWTLSTRRSMDAPAPGDWTVILHRGPFGRAAGLTLGCWLARGVEYRRG
ncbi:MAG: D-aminopeptidase [Gemmobacter sp.]|jgi:D-aminopeptidase|nr:D-aminopeptidase [Gemmobacter sp.]